MLRFDVRDREYLAHVAMVDLQPGAKLMECILSSFLLLLSTKKRLKAALFVKINKKSTLWIYVCCNWWFIVISWNCTLIEKGGFFKRLTREAWREYRIGRESLMKEQLDNVADDVDMELDENVERN
ncbi:unnamed protein product [Ceratitis capitata]|uniref:(Mediterranean fruit fly) hypothetical protein n=1 Tax=Ceratitis capitata TaxID=7213 RepID=A0A811VG80_CERCA|nr:unnamed protein product [Ceratitis capitata]